MSETGMQNERTSLAWQRTALSIMVAALIMARLAYERLGLTALALAGMGFVASGWAFWESRSRYRQRAGFRPSAPARGGRSGLALAAAVMLIATIELLALVESW